MSVLALNEPVTQDKGGRRSFENLSVQVKVLAAVAPPSCATSSRRSGSERLRLALAGMGER